MTPCRRLPRYQFPTPDDGTKETWVVPPFLESDNSTFSEVTLKSPSGDRNVHSVATRSLSFRDWVPVTLPPRGLDLGENGQTFAHPVDSTDRDRVLGLVPGAPKRRSDPPRGRTPKYPLD